MKKLIDIINTDNEPNILNDMVFGSGGVKTNNMKNIHILPTDKPSRLYEFGLEYHLQIKSQENFRSHNIYITSDEEIKEGDWIFANQGVHKVIDIKDGKYPYGTVNYKEDKIYHHKSWKKIILTTDQDLIKDGVQAIDDEFLEWFVKNPSCEWVEVIKEYKDGFRNWYKYQDDFFSDHFKPFAIRYKIIIPKEEPKQEKDDSYIKEQKERRRKLLNLINKLEEEKLQEEIVMKETLEEAAENFVNSTRLRNYKVLFMEGAKWQQEDMIEELEKHILINEDDWNRNPQAQLKDFIKSLNKQD